MKGGDPIYDIKALLDYFIFVWLILREKYSVLGQYIGPTYNFYTKKSCKIARWLSV